MKKNTMVPYESIDPTGARALRPGVTFFVSNKTIAELIVEKGLCPSPELMGAASGSANGRKMSAAEAMYICALADGEATSTDMELALAALKAEYGGELWELYHRIGDVLRNHRPPDMSADFAELLAARLDEEASRNQRSSVAGEAKPAMAMPLSLERPSLIFPDSRR